MKQTNPSHILILAPEITKGMKSIGSKALLTLHSDKSIIDYQIQYLQKHYKKAKITIATGFEGDKIEKKTQKYNVDYTYNANYEISNHGTSIELFLRSNIVDIKTLLVISNGILLKNLLAFNLNESTIFTLQKPNGDYNLGVNQHKAGSKLPYLFYGFPVRWTECVAFNKNAVETLETIISHTNISQMFLFEIVNKLIDQNCKFTTSTVQNKNIYKVSTVKNTKKAKSFYA